MEYKLTLVEIPKLPSDKSTPFNIKFYAADSLHKYFHGDEWNHIILGDNEELKIFNLHGYPTILKGGREIKKRVPIMSPYSSPDNPDILEYIAPKKGELTYSFTVINYDEVPSKYFKPGTIWKIKI